MVDTVTENYQKHIRSLIGQQGQVSRPTNSICGVIANLKDLCEVGGGAVQGWRGGSGGASPEPGSPFRFHGEPRRMNFRGGAGAPDTPLSRVQSGKSIATSDSASSPTYSATPPAPIAKYQSRFKNSSAPVESKILNNIILSKLNKFSAKTYDEIRDFLYQILGSGEPDLQEMIRDFMRLVFRKAASEEVFCPLYAKLLCEISARYSVILSEMQALQLNYLDIFDDVAETGNADYNTFVESQKDKQYRRGYSQFLAELIGQEILDFDLLKKVFQRILANMVAFGKMEDKKTLLEEYADCLGKMSKVLKGKRAATWVRARAALFEDNQVQLTDLVENYKVYPSETSKARFMLMDVLDALKA